MNSAHYLKTDIRRLIKNHSIYLAIVGVAVSIWFSLEDYAFNERMVNGNVLDTYSMAANMSGIMIVYAFCAFSYATVFCAVQIMFPAKSTQSQRFAGFNRIVKGLKEPCLYGLGFGANILFHRA